MSVQLRLPLFRILFGFLAGILAVRNLPLSVHVPLGVLFALCVGQGIVVYFLFPLLRYSSRWVAGIPILFFFSLSAYHLTALTDNRENPAHFSNHPSGCQFLAGLVKGPLIKGSTSYRSRFSVFALRDSSGWKSAEGTVLLYFKEIPASVLPRHGDTLIIKALPRELKDPLNPEQFNYRKYLATQRIYHQVYLGQDDYLEAGTCGRFSLLGLAIELRNSLSEMLQQCGLSGSELGIAEALLIGDKSHLDQETYNAFSASGTIHILCVSGMHVGVIFMLLNTLLSFLSHSLHQRLGRTTLILLLIWFYAILTGLTPSVLRASAMFTFLAIGGTFRRHTNIFNTLAVSALLLLLVDPLFLDDKGFQLSYLAVIGILVIQPWMQRLLDPSWWIMEKTWSMVTVTLAAQIATFPLTVHLFHQFPVYFMLSNLLVIPLSGLIIYLGILLVIFFPVSFLRYPVAEAFAFLIRILDRSVRWFEELPHSTWSGISLSFTEMLLIYGMIMSLILFLIRKQRVSVFYFLVCIIFFQVSVLVRKIDRERQKVFAVYAVQRNTAIGFYRGSQGLVLLDSILFESRDAKTGFLAGHVNQLGINAISYSSFTERDSCSGASIIRMAGGFLTYIQFCDKRICIVDKDLSGLATPSERFKADLVVIRKNSRIRLQDVRRIVDSPEVIVDLSVPPWVVEKWSQDDHEGIYKITNRGAFIRDW